MVIILHFEQLNIGRLCCWCFIKLSFVLPLFVENEIQLRSGSTVQELHIIISFPVRQCIIINYPVAPLFDGQKGCAEA